MTNLSFIVNTIYIQPEVVYFPGWWLVVYFPGLLASFLALWLVDEGEPRYEWVWFDTNIFRCIHFTPCQGRYPQCGPGWKGEAANQERGRRWGERMRVHSWVQAGHAWLWAPIQGWDWDKLLMVSLWNGIGGRTEGGIKIWEGGDGETGGGLSGETVTTGQSCRWEFEIV